jgi:hypothetical protein
MAALNSAYTKAPHMARTPPNPHNTSRAGTDGVPPTWNPRLVNTPVPMVLARTTPTAAHTPRDGRAGGEGERDVFIGRVTI